MTAADRLRKMQEIVAKHEAEFLERRPQKDAAKLDGLAMEIRRVRLEIDALLGLPPIGRPQRVNPPRPKQPPGLLPARPPRGRAPDWKRT